MFNYEYTGSTSCVLLLSTLDLNATWMSIPLNEGGFAAYLQQQQGVTGVHKFPLGSNMVEGRSIFKVQPAWHLGYRTLSHDQPVICSQLSSPGGRMVTRSGDYLAHIWNVLIGTPRGKLKEHLYWASEVTGAACWWRLTWTGKAILSFLWWSSVLHIQPINPRHGANEIEQGTLLTTASRDRSV